MTTTTDVQRPGANAGVPDVHVGRGVLMPLDEVLRRIRHLSHLERDVLILRMGRTGDVARTVSQTAESLGISRSQVGAVESLAWAKVRHPSTSAEIQGIEP